MEPRIRPYQPHDLAAVYEVCLRTGDAGEDASQLIDDPDILGHLYVGPYLTLEPDLAFVLEDAQGVCGYVLGAFDSERFERRFRSEWLPRLHSRYPAPASEPATWTATERLYHRLHHPGSDLPEALRAYPSHLHIDLLKRAQGRGHGRRMVRQLLSALREHGSHGVWLGVDRRNERAIGFYRTVGFLPVAPRDERSGTLFMAMPLGRRPPPPAPS